MLPREMNWIISTTAVYALLILVSMPGTVLARGDLTRQEPIMVEVLLGTREGDLRFVPDNLEFETGKLYRLVLRNPSNSKHYFVSPGLSKSVYTRKVEVMNAAGKRIAEIKGSIREVELDPGGHAEWWFVPVATADLDDLHCTVEGHSGAGMTGTIQIR